MSLAVELQELRARMIEQLVGELDYEDQLSADALDRDFLHFLENIEVVYPDVYDSADIQQQLFEEVPDIRPYWNFLLSMRAQKQRMYQAMSSDRDKTVAAVANVVNSKDTYTYVQRREVNTATLKNSQEKRYLDVAQPNMKVLHISHVLAYALSGKGSALMQDLEEQYPNGVPEKTKQRRFDKDIRENIHYWHVSDSGIEDVTARAKGTQPTGSVTDGVVLEELAHGGVRVHLVCATSKSSPLSQRRQLFDYTDRVQRQAIYGMEHLGIRQFDKVCPVFVSGPVVPASTSENFLTMLWRPEENSNAHKYPVAAPLSAREIEVLNGLPMLAQLANIDNTRSEVHLDTFINTTFFTVGGGSSLDLHNRLSQLSHIGIPERHKMLLRICARRMDVVAKILVQQARAQDPESRTERLIKRNDLLSKMMQTVTNAMNGIVSHALAFHDDPGFIKDISTTLGHTGMKLAEFDQHIPEPAVKEQVEHERFQEITMWTPEELDSRMQKLIAKRNQKQNTLAYSDAVLPSLKDWYKAYVGTYIAPLMKRNNKAVGLLNDALLDVLAHMPAQERSYSQEELLAPLSLEHRSALEEVLSREADPESLAGQVQKLLMLMQDRGGARLELRLRAHVLEAGISPDAQFYPERKVPVSAQPPLPKRAKSLVLQGGDG